MKKLSLFVLIVLGLFVLAVPGNVRAEQQLSSADVVLVSPDELRSIMEEGKQSITLLDLRSPGAYDNSEEQIRGATRIAPGDLPDRLWELPFGTTIVTFCT